MPDRLSALAESCSGRPQIRPLLVVAKLQHTSEAPTETLQTGLFEGPKTLQEISRTPSRQEAGRFVGSVQVLGRQMDVQGDGEDQ